MIYKYYRAIYYYIYYEGDINIMIYIMKETLYIDIHYGGIYIMIYILKDRHIL